MIRGHYSEWAEVGHRRSAGAWTPAGTWTAVVRHAVVQWLRLWVRLRRVAVASGWSQRNRESSVDGQQAVAARRHRRDALLQRAILGFQLIQTAQQWCNCTTAHTTAVSTTVSFTTLAPRSSGRGVGFTTIWSRVRFPAAAARTGMGDCLLVGKQLISPTHTGQLSLLPSVGREINTSQSVVMLRGWGVKAGMVHSICGQMCGWQVKLCDVLLNATVAVYSVESSEVLHYQRTKST